ncbi:hypothetical protein ACFQX6_67070 [Streptosporangium lutulentum]
MAAAARRDAFSAPAASAEAQTAAFRPATQEDLAPSGQVARVRANLAAVRTVRLLQSEKRAATAEEQQVLARWSGWGAVAAVFDEREEHFQRFAWAREELHALLSDKEYAAAAGNTLNAFYTNPAIASPIWQALQDLGFTEGQVIEASCGSGTFIGLAPPGRAWSASRSTRPPPPSRKRSTPTRGSWLSLSPTAAPRSRASTRASATCPSAEST